VERELHAEGAPPSAGGSASATRSRKASASRGDDGGEEGRSGSNGSSVAVSDSIRPEAKAVPVASRMLFWQSALEKPTQYEEPPTFKTRKRERRSIA